MAVADEGVRLGKRATRLRNAAAAAERAYADWLFVHRNDTDLWDDAEAYCDTPEDAARRRELLSVTICARFSPALTRAINRRQRETGASCSELVRAAVAAYTRPSLNLSFGQTPRTVNLAAASLRLKV